MIKITIYRGTQEIGGTLIELKTANSRILIDAGYPLFLQGNPIEDRIAKLSSTELLELGVLPKIKGLYTWNSAGFDAVIISHAHLDHYGLLKYINPAIPVYMSAGTQKLIEISQLFKLCDIYNLTIKQFKMFEVFLVGDYEIMPYLMDHSAFDAAAFEIKAEGKTVIYTGDFRGHGHKALFLDRFIKQATKSADVLLTEGTMLGRQDENVQTEEKLKEAIVDVARQHSGPVLFQSSGQNIDRLVTFFKVALSLKKTFVIDLYTANVLYELRQLGNNHLPFPSDEYKNIRVFYPWRLAKKVNDEIGVEYADRFFAYRIKQDELAVKQNNVVMMVRPSMQKDLTRCGLRDGLFIYSLWQGYRSSAYQQKFEAYLKNAGFTCKEFHTSGHAAVKDIQRLITGLDPLKVVPIHTMNPGAFGAFSVKTELRNDGEEFTI